MSQLNRGAVDQGAMWSAAIAAVITLSLGDGRYDWLSLALGTALTLQLATFYRPTPFDPDQRWDRCAAAGSFGAVSGLVAAMVLAWPVQAAIGTPRQCRRAGVSPDDCAGAVAYPWLGVVWVTAATGLACVHWAKCVRQPASPPS